MSFSCRCFVQTCKFTGCCEVIRRTFILIGFIITNYQASITRGSPPVMTAKSWVKKSPNVRCVFLDDFMKHMADKEGTCCCQERENTKVEGYRQVRRASVPALRWTIDATQCDVGKLLKWFWGKIEDFWLSSLFSGRQIPTHAWKTYHTHPLYLHKGHSSSCNAVLTRPVFSRCMWKRNTDKQLYSRPVSSTRSNAGFYIKTRIWKEYWRCRLRLYEKVKSVEETRNREWV